jgi:hypothetical protein
LFYNQIANPPARSLFAMPTALPSYSSFLCVLGVMAVQKFLQYFPVFAAAHHTPAAAAETSRVPAILASTRLLFTGFPPHTSAAVAGFPGLPAMPFGSKLQFGYDKVTILSLANR